MRFVTVNRVTIHHEIIGDPAKKPVLVFINSLGTDFRIWHDVADRLRHAFAIVLYDMRGHGLSDIGGEASSIEDHADDLSGLLDHLSIGRAVICGLSVGGLIAQALYQRRPDLVRALVLCATAHKIGTPDMWNGRIRAVEEGGIEGILDAVMERWFTPAFRSPENAAYAGYRTMLVRQPVAGYAATCTAIRDADYTAAAARIAVPTLCIVGDQDGSTPPDLVRSTATLILGSRFEIIADAGHIPCVEQPDALSETISTFLLTLDQEA
ncbi:3-oxoadipate enol-lactonase [Rhizobium sp. PP-F2F-G38]|uniref:3-oxoadipate enol-lactonase n=1 Tax=Ferranicluibacter rubi TaxID=2715133 RepID=A0AA43ZF39_9HYPH|nr:3-oxoadipate enol-lactonase [Ferranicluibacter rubi]PYE32609.1 3-oxoadipate enol-lactonase [Rhizobium sp. PP-WC-1G-195]PYE96038.1 3-oxoadipate enol-lactonase [Rhizobium sp. PP-F2F-G38]TCP88357.1 3-oxoadipate enol-lactonase [Rhizobium sp. PP-CC-2G-626]TCQ22978.1 3-oxoadipate enol-lactonase [Rhizobium sp. PP-CC-3G-465]NHT75712.1 3-oxoadipate enol-lactonase [Ferranicluibacter rubi]